MSTWKMKIRLSFDEIIPFQWCHICYWGLPKCALWSHNLIRWFYGYVFDLVFAQCTCCIFTNIYVLPKRGEYILGIAFSRQFHPLYRRLYKRRLLLLSTRHKYTSVQAVPLVPHCQANYCVLFGSGTSILVLCLHKGH